MTMQPLPPSVETNIISEPDVPLHHDDDVIFAVGEIGTTAPNVIPNALEVLGPFTTIEDLEGHIGTGGDLPVFAEEVFDQESTTMYLVIIDPSATGAPTNDEVVAALEIVRQLPVEATVLAAPGLTIGGAVGNAQANPASALPSASAVVTELESLADELGCRAVAGAKGLSVANGVVWSTDNSNTPRTMKVFNDADGGDPSGAWLGAALNVTGTYGRQRGIDHGHVRGVTTLAHNLSHSPRAAVSSDVSNLIGAHLSVLVRRSGVIEILGDEFEGVQDGVDTWSVGRVIDFVERLMQHAGESFIGLGNTPSNLQRIAGHLERTGRQSVGAGELLSLRVFPNAEDAERNPNNGTARENGLAYFTAHATVIHAIKHIVIDIILG